MKPKKPQLRFRERFLDPDDLPDFYKRSRPRLGFRERFLDPDDLLAFSKRPGRASRRIKHRPTPSGGNPPEEGSEYGHHHFIESGTGRGGYSAHQGSFAWTGSQVTGT